MRFQRNTYQMKEKLQRNRAKTMGKSMPPSMPRQQQLEIIFSTSKDGISLISVEDGPRYRFVFVNWGFLSATGLQREQVEGKYIDEILSGRSLNTALASYQQVVLTGQAVEWEEVSETPEGLKTGVVTVAPVFDEERECTMLVSTMRDITKNKKTEEEERHIRYLLNERVKELTTLYSSCQILQDETKTVDRALQELVSILPAGWQYPEITEARIIAGEKEYITPGFKTGFDTQTAEFLYTESRWGKIQVAYMEKKPEAIEGPFLAEERNLIHMLAEMLSSFFARNRVTEQLLKEKELSESIIKSLPGIFYVFDQDGKYLRWNKNHETVPGYTTEEMKKISPSDFFDEDEKEKVEASIKKVFAEGYADVEANFKGKNGEKTPYWFNGISIEYEGKPCLLGVGFDISERRKAAEELQEAEIKFRTLVEKSQVGVYIVQGGKFVYVNPRFAEIFGYNVDELLNADAQKTIISEEYHSIARDNLRVPIAGEAGTSHYEVTGKKKNGTFNRVEFYGSWALYKGQPTIIGTMVDITERKLAEEALHKSEANLHTILDNTDTIYKLLDNNFQIISFNQRAFDFVKKELHRELKLQTSHLNYFPEKRRADILEKLNRALAGEQVTYESSYAQKNGSVNWYHIRIFPISNQGRGFGVMVAISDITEKKLLEQEIMNQKVQEQKRIIRAVLNAQESERNKIGQELHDNVNQILVGAKMYLGLVSHEQPGTTDLIKQSLHLVDNAIDEIRALTWREVTPPKKIGLKDIIQSLVENTNAHSKVKTKLVYPTDAYIGNNDLKLNIYRIIQEAINNVLKHADARNVLLAVEASNKDIHIRIEDDGKGFNPVFNKSNGVGITNMLNRVESYNGNITIDSIPDNGCKIQITIPM